VLDKLNSSRRATFSIPSRQSRRSPDEEKAPTAELSTSTTPNDDVQTGNRQSADRHVDGQPFFGSALTQSVLYDDHARATRCHHGPKTCGQLIRSSRIIIPEATARHRQSSNESD
jgi:hypothetical protein